MKKEGFVMKKIVSVVLALSLLLAMPMGVFAANAIKGIDTQNYQANIKKNGENGLILLDKKAIKLDALQNLEVAPGNVIKIYLTADLFVDSAGKSIASQSTNPEYVDRNQIRHGKITLRRATSSGSKAFDNVSIKYDTKGAYINIAFVESYSGTKALDFSTKLYLYVDNKRVTATALTVSGTLEVETISLYGDTDYIYLADGTVAEAVEYVPRVEINMGSGVSIVTSVSRGRRIYATCSNKVSSADAKVLKQYKDVQEVLTLSTLNVRKTGKPVYIDVDYRMYVYDSNGAYVGTTKQMLPYSDKYYLSDLKYASLKLS